MWWCGQAIMTAHSNASFVGSKFHYVCRTGDNKRHDVVAVSRSSERSKTGAVLGQNILNGMRRVSRRVSPPVGYMVTRDVTHHCRLGSISHLCRVGLEAPGDEDSKLWRWQQRHREHLSGARQDRRTLRGATKRAAPYQYQARQRAPHMLATGSHLTRGVHGSENLSLPAPSVGCS